VELALLIIGVVGALAAIAAAVFTYPPWRDSLLKPHLELRIRSVAGYQQSGPIIRTANLELELHNTGKGEASTWRLELHTRTSDSTGLQLPNPRALSPGEEQYQLPGQITVVAWRAVDANEVIPPGDKSRGLGPVMVDPPTGADAVFDCRRVTPLRRSKRSRSRSVP
jgi:hypothetical protein